jgi:hypothetical protein
VAKIELVALPEFRAALLGAATDEIGAYLLRSGVLAQGDGEHVSAGHNGSD